MINLVYGKVKGIKPPRVTVQLTGIEGDAELECMLLQPGGQSDDQRQWTAPLEGDIVAVLYDSERPEVSLILGGVYSDTQEVPQGDGVAIQTKNVQIKASGDIIAQGKTVKAGKNMNMLFAASRSDIVDAELLNVKSALDTIVTMFNSHTHLSTAVGSPTSTPSESTPPTTMINTYDPGNTGCDSVFIN